MMKSNQKAFISTSIIVAGIVLLFLIVFNKPGQEVNFTLEKIQSTSLPANTQDRSALIIQADSDSIGELFPMQSSLGGDIKVKYQLPKAIYPGQVLDIEFTLISSNRSGELVLTVQAENSEILNQPDIQHFNLEESQEHKFTLSIYSGKNVRAYINLFITERIEQLDINREVHSIPIQFGLAISQEINGVDRNQDEDELIRSMPAQETIINDASINDVRKAAEN